MNFLVCLFVYLICLPLTLVSLLWQWFFVVIVDDVVVDVVVFVQRPTNFVTLIFVNVFMHISPSSSPFSSSSQHNYLKEK